MQLSCFCGENHHWDTAKGLICLEKADVNSNQQPRAFLCYRKNNAFLPVELTGFIS